MKKLTQRPDDILFSVLIANYNNGRYISEAINSVIVQTYTNWEIIVVDDASTDGSMAIIRPFLNDTRIRLFTNDGNQGCGYTKKRCIDLATGNICGFLDPDDIISVDALEIMVREHLMYSDLALINSTHYQCDEALHVLQISPYPRRLPDGKRYLSLNDGSIHHFAAFKKSYYLLTKGLNPKFKKAIDQHLYLLLDSVGNSGFINKPLYYYRIHEGGISNFNNVEAAFLQHLQIIKDVSKDQRIEKDSNLAKRELNRVYYQASLKIAYLKRQWLVVVLLAYPYILYGGFDEICTSIRKKLNKKWAHLLVSEDKEKV